MLTYDNILKEIKDVPPERLEELYSFIHSLTSNSDNSQERKLKILSYADLLTDMSAKEYDDFIADTKRTRQELFERNADL